MSNQPASRIDAHFIAAGKYHDIDYPRLEILKLLAEEPHIRTTVAADYSGLERLNQCRFLITYTCDLMPTEEQAKQLRSWLEGGGKWLALHGTNSILVFTEEGLVDAPENRPDVFDMLGTQFKAHPPIGQFEVEVVNKDHELTRGIEDFEIVDELYLSKTTADIDTLMQTTFEGDATGFVEENGRRPLFRSSTPATSGKGALSTTRWAIAGVITIYRACRISTHTRKCARGITMFITTCCAVQSAGPKETI